MANAARNTVHSVGKAFDVLRAFDAAHPELTIKETASRAGLDRGTGFRLIHTLIELGMLAAVPGTRRVRLTLRCLELGYAALASSGLKGHCAPLPREPVPGIGEAASLDACGLRTVAAPVLEADGSVRATISLTARREGEPAEAFVARALPHLLRMAAELSRASRLLARAA